MRAISFICASALLLGSCDRYSGPTQVSGIVTDAHTGQRVPNAIVQVLGSSTSWSGGGTNGAGTAKTDAQGRFSLSFEAGEHELYQLQASSVSGYTPLSTPYVDGGRKTENVEVKVLAPAWVKINCVDDPPLGKAGLNTSGYNNPGDNQTIGPGNYSFVRPTQSYFSNVVLWRIIDDKTAQVSEGKESYTTTGFDTATVTIHF